MDGLPAGILEKILTGCEPEDIVQLRATCTKIRKVADDVLYRSSMEQVKQKPVEYRREFFRDNTAFITLVHDGKYRSKDEAIEFCVEKLELNPEEKTRAAKELSEKGRSANFRSSQKEKWERELKVQKDLTQQKTMDVWKQFYRGLEDWHTSYLTTVDHVPENKRETFQPIRDIHHVLFGLFLGSEGFCLTSIERRDFGRHFETSSRESYILLSGKQGDTFALELKTSNFHEYWG